MYGEMTGGTCSTHNGDKFMQNYGRNARGEVANPEISELKVGQG